MPYLSADFDDDVARVVFERPQHRNALDLDTLDAFTEALLEAERRGCRAVRISGAGDDLSAGRDHRERAHADPARWHSASRSVAGALQGFGGLSIVAARGMAYGFGCVLAATADLCIASESARFALDEVPRGYTPKFVMGQLMVRLPERVVIDLVCTGRTIGAQEAMRLGIVSQVVDDLCLEAAVDRLTARITSNDPRALRDSKRHVRGLATLTEIGRREAAAIYTGANVIIQEA
ncbi:enoyl-CoA hydratase/isomerase family protein [Jiangella ureilytica]|uniref:Enoyl-CoA hydratase/isomerase family protein n=1 Tax=Jiangella ureilytica TaxID=2530374 RepID=A0A4R4RVZ1_9ACTN|nr:enoyl-CoA hydratase/isomerase family protein [Jiangella ureilytica]TDC52753.1 enoyl-CoA hydratase/isomerase family protein [Jiangella ureilytica]